MQKGNRICMKIAVRMILLCPNRRNIYEATGSETNEKITRAKFMGPVNARQPGSVNSTTEVELRALASRSVTPATKTNRNGQICKIQFRLIRNLHPAMRNTIPSVTERSVGFT